MNMMRWFAAGLALCGLFSAAPCFAAESKPETTDAPRVIAASGTSYGKGSSDVICLLDPNCEGYWTPETADAGVNEGIYIQFEEPVLLNYIEIEAEADAQTELQTYLDGKAGSAGEPAKTAESSVESDTEPGAPENAELENAEPERAIKPEEQRLRASFSRYLYTSRDREDNGRAVFLVSSGEQEGLAYSAKSVFIKIQQAQDGAPPVRIRAVRFYTYAASANEPAPTTSMPLRLPVSVKATATASSTLSPQFAYDVSHLFDSQMDMAWSTDGKTTDGVNTSLTVDFGAPQTVSGLMVWNGYQRSDVHYRANGRVRTLAVGGQSVTLKDAQGPQVVMLPKPVTAGKLNMKITGIYPGGSYPDVLLSELRFVTPDGGLLLPVVAGSKPKTTPIIDFMRDRTFVGFIHAAGDSFLKSPEWARMEELARRGEEPYAMCIGSSLRLRGNGTFVIYAGGGLRGDSDKDEAQFPYTGVTEGNWEVLDGHTLRLFGKRYASSTAFTGSGYLQDTEAVVKALPAPKIFQSAMRVFRYNDLSVAERNNLIQFIIRTRKVNDGVEPGADYSAFYIQAASIPAGTPDSGEYASEMFFGATRSDAASRLDARLRELNPLTVKSDVYTEILLPPAQVGVCNDW